MLLKMIAVFLLGCSTSLLFVQSAAGDIEARAKSIMRTYAYIFLALAVSIGAGVFFQKL